MRGGKSTVWAGGLPREIDEKELEKQFEKYGPISEVRLPRTGSGPPFAFIEFKNADDAADCIDKMDAEAAFNHPVRIEGEGRAAKRRDSRDRGRRSRSRGGAAGRRSRSRGRRDTVPVGNHKITLERLPHDMTWIELKELGKQYVDNARDVTFARTYRNRDGDACGIIEFVRRDDADYVVKKLDDRKIKDHDERLVVKYGAERRF